MREKILFIGIALFLTLAQASAEQCGDCCSGITCTEIRCVDDCSGSASIGQKCWFHRTGAMSGTCYDCDSSKGCEQYMIDACEDDTCGIPGGCHIETATSTCVAGKSSALTNCQECCISGGMPCTEYNCRTTCSNQNKDAGGAGCWSKEITGGMMGNVECAECDKSKGCSQYDREGCSKDECGIGGCSWDDSAQKCSSEATGFDCYTCCENAGLYCQRSDCETCSAQAMSAGGKGCLFIKLGVASGTCKKCEAVSGCSEYQDEETCGSDVCEAAEGECVWEKDKCKDEGAKDGMGWGSVIEDIKKAIKDIVCTVYCLLLYLVGGVAALVMIMSGMNYMTNEDASGRAEARKRITYSLVALIVIITGCPIINLLFGGTVLGVTPCQCNCGLPGQTGRDGTQPPTDGEGAGGCRSSVIINGVPNCIDDLGNRFPYSCGPGAGGQMRQITYRCSLTNIGKCEPTTTYCLGDACEGYQCASNPAGPSPDQGQGTSLACDNTNYCERQLGSYYCGPKTDGFCHQKVGLGATCTSSMEHEGNPSFVCISRYCVNGICALCPDDLECKKIHGQNYVCGPGGECVQS